MAHRIPRESDIEQWAMREAKKHGMKLVKWTSPGNNGVPDRILLGPNAKTAYIEFKRPGKKLTPLQAIWRDRLLDWGHEWHMVDSKESFMGVLKL